MHTAALSLSVSPFRWRHTRTVVVAKPPLLTLTPDTVDSASHTPDPRLSPLNQSPAPISPVPKIGHRFSEMCIDAEDRRSLLQQRKYLGRCVRLRVQQLENTIDYVVRKGLKPTARKTLRRSRGKTETDKSLVKGRDESKGLLEVEGSNPRYNLRPQRCLSANTSPIAVQTLIQPPPLFLMNKMPKPRVRGRKPVAESYRQYCRVKRYPGVDQPFALSPSPSPLSPDSRTSSSIGLRTAMETWYNPPSPVVYRRSALTEQYNSNVIDMRRMKKPKVVSASVAVASLQTGGEATLTFESRFESGNLAVASKKSDSEYNLLLQNDTNSRGNTQWFYFRVSNTTAGATVRFNILNLGKGGSLYSSGMKILVLSEIEHTSKSLSWHRACEDISYRPNNIRREGTGKSHYTLSFVYTFPHSQDTVYFSYAYPYTYSDLVEDLNQLEADSERVQFMTRKELCLTMMGNKCEYLTISAPSRAPNVKKGVVISARVHPGETVGSFMMKGVLDFLTSSAPEAQILREHYVFKLIPMLNPDGVIHGNYRCGLAGADLNRRWKHPSKTLHPTIYHAKRMIKLFAKERDLSLLCDLHGHSRRRNIFMYGCPIPADPSASRLFPFILSKVSPFFHYPGCSFRLQEDKEQTQRITIFKETANPCIYTLEATFSGMSVGPFAGQHLTMSQLQDMGKQLCLALLVYGNLGQTSVPQPMPDDCSGSTGEISREQCLSELAHLGYDTPEDNGSDAGGSSGSDSDPSEDNLDPEELTKLLPAASMSNAMQRKSTLLRENSATRPTRRKEEVKEPQRCKLCLEPDIPGHVCAKVRVLKPLSNPYSRLYTKRIGLRTFISPITGKTMHDQATQTPKQGISLECRSRSLPASVASTREAVSGFTRPKDLSMSEVKVKPEEKSQELRSGSQDRRLPVLSKSVARDTSAYTKPRKVK